MIYEFSVLLSTGNDASKAVDQPSLKPIRHNIAGPIKEDVVQRDEPRRSVALSLDQTGQFNMLDLN